MRAAWLNPRRHDFQLRVIIRVAPLRARVGKPLRGARRQDAKSTVAGAAPLRICDVSLEIIDAPLVHRPVVNQDRAGRYRVGVFHVETHFALFWNKHRGADDIVRRGVRARRLFGVHGERLDLRADRHDFHPLVHHVEPVVSTKKDEPRGRFNHARRLQTPDVGYILRRRNRIARAGFVAVLAENCVCAKRGKKHDLVVQRAERRAGDVGLKSDQIAHGENGGLARHRRGGVVDVAPVVGPADEEPIGVRHGEPARGHGRARQDASGRVERLRA